jgi:ferredoxin
MTSWKNISVPAGVFLLTIILLAFVQLKVERPLILAERFIKGAGWIEIVVVALYGSFIAWKMKERNNVPKWRIITWTVFSFVFFSQLVTGLLGAEMFLMTGKLHLPVPMMIAAGPVYRQEISVMTILFLSTVLLTGPAWCSHFCYFGALDGAASWGKTSRKQIKNKVALKITFLALVIGSAILLRILKIDLLVSTLLAVSFGIVGILVIFLFSTRRKKMVHCIIYCPIGTIVNLLKHVNPFRMRIDKSCTLCMHCTSYCKYDALNQTDIIKGKPGITCTLCGDCLSGCSHNSIIYSFPGMKPEAARNLYLVLTITIHVSCIALARI